MPGSRDLTIELFPRESFARTHEVLVTGLAEGAAPGFVLGLWEASAPERIRAMALGERRRLPSSQPMGLETIFDLASITKVMGTATLAALLVERGSIGWNTPVKSILPEAWEGVELRHLLAHTAGLVWWMPVYEKLRQKFLPLGLDHVPIADRQKAARALILGSKPERPPGEKAVYSDLTFMTLGFALEEVTKMPLDRAVTELVWRPMGIEDAHYRRIPGAAPFDVETAAATEDCPWRKKVLQGEVHDDNCWAMGGYAGHAGAFGTVRDVMQFAKAMFEGFLSPAVLDAAWARVSEPEGCERTLGWDTPSGPEPSMSSLFSRRTVGHLGFSGTSLWIDPEARLAVTLLSNRVHPSRENIKIRALRPALHRALRLDLGR
ncbi:MAG TPA: serine hydrolase domain-containing protein [Bdellovibrionota bacterium]|nr:serine hydrolase domain-containing protein [Bdellovibrionota bacterium]